MTIRSLFRRKDRPDPVRDLYGTVTRQARLPDFYVDWGVPDTVDGRFDMITLHAFLVLHRLKSEDEQGEPLAQAFFDLMFADMDWNLREMGAGDLGVGRRVKTMVSAFYGRIAAYEKGLTDDAANLVDSLRRNLYRGATVPDHAVEQMADYVRREVENLSRLPFDSLTSGTLSFGPPPQRKPAP
jgi:cytochrome b pre-mRNA-processing protein 3